MALCSAGCAGLFFNGSWVDIAFATLLGLMVCGAHLMRARLEIGTEGCGADDQVGVFDWAAASSPSLSKLVEVLGNHTTLNDPAVPRPVPLMCMPVMLSQPHWQWASGVDYCRIGTRCACQRLPSAVSSGSFLVRGVMSRSSVFIDHRLVTTLEM